MADSVWIGTTADFNTAGNWSPSGVPATASRLIFNDQAVGPLTDNLVQAAKEFDVIVNRSFQYYIGGAGAPLKPDNFNLLLFEGMGTTASYFEAAAAGQFDNILIDTQSTLKNGVHIAGKFDRLTVRSGSAQVDSGATCLTGINLNAGQGSGLAELTIQSGCTMTGSIITQRGGVLSCSSSPVDVIVHSGEFTLDGSADITGHVETYDGSTFIWKAAGTSGDHSIITLAEVFGGIFKTVNERLYRTLTAGNVYGGGLFDFSIGGLAVTFTNALRCYSTQSPKFPKGATITGGV